MRRERRLLLGLSMVVMTVSGIGMAVYFGQVSGRVMLVVATTTSLYDTGLLDDLRSVYEAAHPDVRLAFVATGTGMALESARHGDAQLVLVHAPALEAAFMREGYGVNRKVFAYNFFVVVGPPEDPAGIAGLDVVSALTRIVGFGRTENASVWVSRDDSSGTNVREKALWMSCGLDYDVLRQEAWFMSSGAGMGRTLTVADELGLYTLSDVGTYLKYSSDGLVHLRVFVENESALLNVYSVMAVNHSLVSPTEFSTAMDLVAFIVGPAQDLIGQYGVDAYGRPLFYPAVSVLTTGRPPTTAEAIRTVAFIDYEGTAYECPPPYRVGEYGLYP